MRDALVNSVTAIALGAVALTASVFGCGALIDLFVLTHGVDGCHAPYQWAGASGTTYVFAETTRTPRGVHVDDSRAQLGAEGLREMDARLDAVESCQRVHIRRACLFVMIAPTTMLNDGGHAEKFACGGQAKGCSGTVQAPGFLVVEPDLGALAHEEEHLVLGASHRPQSDTDDPIFTRCP